VVIVPTYHRPGNHKPPETGMTIIIKPATAERKGGATGRPLAAYTLAA
jgi:hypothetical protein